MTSGNKPQVEVEGLGRLGRQLKALDADLAKELTAVNKGAAELVETTARTKVRVRSGKLRRSIRSGGTMRFASVRAGSASVPYAPAIHWGWPGHNVAPQPFLYEALDSRAAQVKLLYEIRVRSLCNRAFHGGPDR